MGQTLSEPVVNKLSSRGGDKRTAYGASAMQGWRVTMEDAHTALPNVFAALNAKNTSSASGGSGSPGSSHKSASSSLSSSPNRNSAIVDSPPSPPSTAQQQQQQQGDASSNNNKEEHFGFYAVFDGHGGNSAAQYAAEFLHKNIISQDEFKAGDYEAALKKGFLTCDEQFYEDPRSVTNPSGCTAITALFTPDGRVFVANAGDSRAIISIKGTAQAMSIDHKPSVATEAARIKAAGGFIEFGRVNGNLALSRALGDFDFKKSQDLPPQQQVVTCDPEIMTINLKKEEHEFVVLACDGIWDCISNQALVDYIRMMITYHPYSTLDEICERIMDICLAPECEVGGLGSDNMSIMIVALLDGRTEDEWKQWVASNYRTQNAGKEADLFKHYASIKCDDSDTDDNDDDPERGLPTFDIGDDFESGSSPVKSKPNANSAAATKAKAETERLVATAFKSDDQNGINIAAAGVNMLFADHPRRKWMLESENGMQNPAGRRTGRRPGRRGPGSGSSDWRKGATEDGYGWLGGDDDAGGAANSSDGAHVVTGGLAWRILEALRARNPGAGDIYVSLDDPEDEDGEVHYVDEHGHEDPSAGSENQQQLGDHADDDSESRHSRIQVIDDEDDDDNHEEPEEDSFGVEAASSITEPTTEVTPGALGGLDLDINDGSSPASSPKIAAVAESSEMDITP